MIVLTTRYPGKIDSATAGFPGGRIKNETTPGSTNDGTPLDAAWGNNIEGIFQAILAEAGLTPDNNIEQVGASQVLTALKSIIALGTVPTGAVQYFARSTAPAGWIKLNGMTIGNASSGATNRANADTLNLYTLLWTEFSNTLLPIQTSAGALTTRGASAAADFAANKRLPLLDLRANFIRGLDDGRGIETRDLGSFQDHALQDHYHPYSTPSYNSETQGGSQTRPWNATGGNTSGAAGANVGTETRPRNSALLTCIKL